MKTSVEYRELPFKMAIDEFEEAKNIIVKQGLIREPYKVTNGNVIQTILLLGTNELNTEEFYLANGGYETLNRWGLMKYQTIHQTDNVISGNAELPEDRVVKATRQLKYLYPEMTSKDELTQYSFLAQLGFLWLKRIEEGQITVEINN